jgi:hypothetical protein
VLDALRWAELLAVVTTCCAVDPPLEVAPAACVRDGLATWLTSAELGPGASAWASATAVVNHIAVHAIGTQTRPFGTGSRTPGTVMAASYMPGRHLEETRNCSDRYLARYLSDTYRARADAALLAYGAHPSI